MKLNKNVQYGLLVVLYLSRSGRARGRYIAEGLGLSYPYMEQVCSKLSKAGVLKATKGPKGGYEVVGEPTVGDVLAALKTRLFLDAEDMQWLTLGTADHRAMAQLVYNMRSAMSLLLLRKVKSIGHELVANEMCKLDRLHKTSINQLLGGN